ncbi:MAG: VOC family protein [Proteobacteria bacterium]|nr:VOC family protein [Pseudomonadota bacterium]
MIFEYLRSVIAITDAVSNRYCCDTLAPMAKVLGIGGVFVKSRDPDRLRAWYRDVLGMEVESWGVMFANEAGSIGTWNAFALDTPQFDASDREFMINLRVDDADDMATQLRARGANVLDRRTKDAYGTFCYVLDPDGTLLELWSAAP